MLAACDYIGLQLEWEGSGDTEVAKEKGTGVVSEAPWIHQILPRHAHHRVASGPHPGQPEVLPADGGGAAAGGPHQGQDQARLDAQGGPWFGTGENLNPSLGALELKKGNLIFCSQALRRDCLVKGTKHKEKWQYVRNFVKFHPLFLDV